MEPIECRPSSPCSDYEFQEEGALQQTPRKVVINSQASGSSERKRKPRFNGLEVEYLIHLLEENIDNIQGSFNHGSTKAMRVRSWDDMVTRFNAKGISPCYRSKTNLQDKKDSLVQKVKSKAAAIAAKRRQSGAAGGAGEELTNLEVRLLGIMGKESYEEEPVNLVGTPATATSESPEAIQPTDPSDAMLLETVVQIEVMLLNYAVQQYEWGKLGENSEVAQLAMRGCAGFTVKQQAPYAELWMGTHPKGPSVIASNGQTLSDYVKQHPECVGQEVQHAFPTPGQLPFLFKVLSVNKALSIQAHPNKSHAEQLHAEKPDKYPDANHKPEMCIALTRFEGLCGFRPKSEIQAFIRDVPEFASILGESLVEKLEHASVDETGSILQACFTALMTCDPALVQEKLRSLLQRLEKSKAAGLIIDTQLGELFLQIHKSFPGDVGCFVIYFLNHMTLQPGEAMFLAANLPHAYLSGDCMECMACSDNVVRAGLTPKFKDVPVLCSMLNYTCAPPADNLFQPVPHPTDPFVTIFNPPIPDFAVNKIQIPTDVNNYSSGVVDSASLVLVIEGEADVKAESTEAGPIPVCRGSLLFMAANEKVKFTVKSSGMLMFQAYCQL